MQIHKFFLAVLPGVLAFGCDGPSSPSFELEHSFQFPLLNNKKVEFIGGANALLDTTSSNFDSLFNIDEEGLASMVFETGFNVGDFGSVLPVISVDPLSFSSGVGLLEASFQGQGKASFTEITGLPGGTIPTVPAGQSGDIFIELDIDDFQKGIIEEGGILVEFTNNLGFEIVSAEAVIISDGAEAGSTLLLTNIAHTQTDEGLIHFDFDEVVKRTLTAEEPGDLQIRVNLEWGEQHDLVVDSASELIIDIRDDSLLASEITAILPGQDFSSNGLLQIDDRDFIFGNGHYVQIESGSIRVSNLVNTIDLDLDQLEITFPGILKPDGSALFIEFSGSSKIHRSGSGQSIGDMIVVLDDHRIFAEGNELEYRIAGLTEDSGLSADPFRTLKSSDYIQADIDMDEIVIKEASGIVRPRMINLNANGSGPGGTSLDLFNDSQAETTSLSDLDFFSKHIQDLRIFGTSLNLIYTTNLGVGTTVYAAILGIGDNGEVYLTGKPGSDYEVASSQDTGGLLANDQDIISSDLIRFDTGALAGPGSPLHTGVIEFNSTNSNIEDFISNMPSEIRFIGNMLANPDHSEGFIQTPVIFDAVIGVDIPMNISTDTPARYTDVLELDLSELPGRNDDVYVSEADLTVHYENSLPFGVEVQVAFLDENDVVIAGFPVTGGSEGQPAKIESAPVDPSTRFVNGVNSGEMEITLPESELEHISKTRKLDLTINFETSLTSEVKLRADDYINLSIFGKFKTKTKVSSE
ncbi:MAG: hypothetical protein WD266_13335 [Balneolales bacterium]